MAKRRTGVNDIIYELDNDDIELSSDDEGKESKKARFETASRSELMENKNDVSIDSNEVVMIDCSDETVSDTEASKQTQNGGKISKITYAKQDVNVDSDSNVTNNVVNVKRSCKKSGSNTIIFNEDIVVDSPASNIDLGVVGCENRTPLLTVRFKDNKLAKMYKKSIKEFMLNLIKLHTNESLNDEEDTDIELDIWPEDLIEENFDKKDEREEEVDDNLFFFDTAPCNVGQIEIPKYSQNSFLISNIPEKEETAPTTFRRGPICFNCDGDHPLRDCHLPRDNAKIAEKRKNITRVGRYHVEDDQKYGHLVPGRISGQLRHALGLKRHEIPMYIYRMRLLGYPPGWLEEARISHSGITLFDSTGNATLEPDEEEGEVCEPGSKDKFDIKKILDFPGFNVPASSRYDEEAHLYGLPPMSEQDSKMAMLQTLAPNAMKAYKRKKLTFFPSAASNSFQEGQVEMELDSGDEIVAFPSIPPLPDEEPPPAPPPPPPPPEDIKDDLTENKKNTPDIQSKKNTVSTKETSKVQEDNKIPDKNDVVSNSTSANDSSNYEKVDDDLSSDDLEIIDVLQVSDIPVPEDDLITIDDDDGVDDEDDKSLLDSGRSSPTLDDLEKKKLLLLNALKGDAVSELEDSIDDIEILEDDDKVDVDAETEGSEVKTDAVEDKIAEVDQNSIEVIDEKTAVVVDNKATPVVKEKASAVVDEKATLVISETATEEVEENAPAVNEKKPELEKSNISTPKSDVVHTTSVMETDVKTPDTKAGQVKKTLYGTPVINVASPYVKLPTEDKFAKDICDVINFENLPNSTGKFKEISTLLKKVKSEVDRIQES